MRFKNEREMKFWSITFCTAMQTQGSDAGRLPSAIDAASVADQAVKQRRLREEGGFSDDDVCRETSNV
jgi:hypothetical protein